jgi:hypothetical protein
MSEHRKNVIALANALKRRLSELAGTQIKVTAYVATDWSIVLTVGLYTRHIQTFPEIASYVIDVNRGGYGNRRQMRVIKTSADYRFAVTTEKLTTAYETSEDLAQAIWEHDLDSRIFERALQKLDTGDSHG